MKFLMILSLLLLSFSAQASRLIEIEDYYSKKTSDFIKTRYPRTAFSVYVKVDAEESPQLRQKTSQRSSNLLNLPYLEEVNPQEVGFWEKKDLSLGAMISYLRSVRIQIDIEENFSSNEMQAFQKELFQHLKLSDTYDRIEIQQKSWNGGASWSEWKPLVLVSLLGTLLLAAALFFIFRNGVSQLVSGLTKPLSEIGKSAENVANSSQLGMDQTSGFQLGQQNWHDDEISSDLLLEARDEIRKLSGYLSDPNAELLSKLEELGESDPLAMGGIFSEMPVDKLKSLTKWSRGEWWRLAITQITPFNLSSKRFLDEIVHLYTRDQLVGHIEDSEIKELKRVLSRLNVKEFGQMLDGVKFPEAEPLLRLLPQEKKVKIAKYLYPGMWAQLLDSKKDSNLKPQQRQSFVKKALQICPLKSEQEVLVYFEEADLTALLDESTTKDEREIYKVLNEKSWVKQQRFPFYEVFQQPESVLRDLASRLPLEVWSLALLDCDRHECETIYSHFTARQRFVLRSYKERFGENQPSKVVKVKAKSRIVSSLQVLLRQEKLNQHKEEANEMAA